MKLTIKNKIKSTKKSNNKLELKSVRLDLNDHQKRLNDFNQDDGASSWLTTLHALSCKKGGFVSLRHNQIRNITASLLQGVCKDVRVERTLQYLTGEEFSERTANISDEARLDICARGFWITCQMAFFDVGVFNPNAKRYVKQDLTNSYEQNEKEKKKAYNERITQIEHGSFTPLVMSATGGMGRECRKFNSRLSAMISDKRNIPYSLAASFLLNAIDWSMLAWQSFHIPPDRENDSGERDGQRINIKY